MTYQYYYNITPEHGKVRNNLIYTSFISLDKKTFVQWYHNDTEYHKGQNQVIDPAKMDDKWNREICYLTYMSDWYPDLVPRIQEIDLINKKIYLEIDGVDFWQQADCDMENYDKVLPDWQEQMLAIIKAHRSLDLYKYSMHPSSYFIVGGKLKSINYFFCHEKREGPLTLADYKSHISTDRQKQMRQHIEKIGIRWDSPEPQHVLQKLCLDSFRTNYPADFIEKAKAIYD
jgi:hypothetical protein